MWIIKRLKMGIVLDFHPLIFFIYLIYKCALHESTKLNILDEKEMLRYLPNYHLCKTESICCSYIHHLLTLRVHTLYVSKLFFFLLLLQFFSFALYFLFISYKNNLRRKCQTLLFLKKFLFNVSFFFFFKQKNSSSWYRFDRWE